MVWTTNNDSKSCTTKQANIFVQTISLGCRSFTGVQPITPPIKFGNKEIKVLVAKGRQPQSSAMPGYWPGAKVERKFTTKRLSYPRSSDLVGGYTPDKPEPRNLLTKTFEQESARPMKYSNRHNATRGNESKQIML
jgi:hypothetical protein